MVIKRKRWKAIFQDTKKEKKQLEKVWIMHFKMPPPVKEPGAFESELIELVKNINFQKV